jgi:DNA repair protein RecO (recombination protein O)
MNLKVKGIVIKEQSIGERDRLVTILTDNEGLIRAFVKSANKVNGKNVASTDLFCYSNFNIYKGRDKYIINEAHPIEVFFELRYDITKLSLATYFCELFATLVTGQTKTGDFLRLILNSIYMLISGKLSKELIKSIVEIRSMTLSGYMPDIVCCNNCNIYESEVMYFIPMRSTILCKNCFDDDLDFGVPMSIATLYALRHIVYSKFDKLFSFTIGSESLRQLQIISENYVLTTLGLSFKTLDFYKQLQQ